MKRIEPGMLCLVVGCTRDPSDIGKVVTTYKYITQNCFFPEFDMYLEGITWLCKSPDIETLSRKPLKGFCLYDAKHLMPICGGDKLEDLETEKDLEETA